MNELFAFLVGLVALVVPGFGATSGADFSGYTEAEYVYAAAVGGGVVDTILVDEGEQIAKGDVLFVLSASQQEANLRAAEARVTAARANLRNLETGSRAEEVEVIRASLRKAEADLSLARVTLERSEKLGQSGLAPAAKLDQDRASLASAQAQVSQLQAQLAVAELPARDAQQAAAEANLLAAQADADRARSELADRTIRASQAGRIENIYFSAGETAAPGVPVISILPDGALKVKFYVGEAERQSLSLGQELGVDCDGCPLQMRARLSHFASEPQFTPPIIYSREERSRLVFLAEATLQDSGGLLPGQPVTVRRLQ